MDKRINEIIDFVVENGLEENILSSNAVKRLYNDRVSRAEKFIKRFGGASEENVVALLIRLIEYAKENKIEDDELQQTQETLVLLLTYRLHAGAIGVSKTLKGLQKCQKDELWQHCFLSQMRNKVLKQSSRSKKSDIDNDNAFWDDLQNELNLKYSDFGEKVENISWIKNKSCTYRWENVVRKGEEIYPILPGALAYDAIRQMMEVRSCALEKVVEPDLELPPWNRSVLETRTLYKAGVDLYREIEDVLSQKLCEIFVPHKLVVAKKDTYRMLFCSPKKMRLDEDQIDTCTLCADHGEEANTEGKEDEDSEEYCGIKAKMFEVLRCKPIKVGRQIAHYYGLSLEQMLWLYQNIAMYLWLPIPFTTELVPLIKEELGEELGRTVSGVLQVFRRMSSVKYYYGPAGEEEPRWHEMLEAEINEAAKAEKYREDVKKLFGYEEKRQGEVSEKQQMCEMGKRIQEGYFYTENMNLRVLTHTFTCPLIGEIEFQEPYFNDVLKEYRRRSEEQYQLPASKGKKKKTPEISPELQKFLLKNLTVQRAVDFVKAYDENIEKNETKMKKQLEPYTEAEISDSEQKEREKLKKYTKYAKDSWNNIYKLLLASSLDVIGHYAIALLRHCMLRQCIIKYESETRRIDADIKRMKQQAAAKKG